MPRKIEKVSINSIAREAGVSVASVSRVIHKRTGVSEDLRKKIHTLAEKYNYTPNYHPLRERKLAVLAGENEFGLYIAEIMGGIHRYASKNKLSKTVIFKSYNPDETILQQVRDQQCSGVIVLLPGCYRDDIPELAKSELPVVLIDETNACEGLGFIDNDSYSGSREAAKHLISLGHCNIGYLKSEIMDMNHIQRFKAYEDAMMNSNLNIQDTWIKSAKLLDNCYAESYAAMKELLKNAPELTAIMARDDTMAFAAMRAIIESGRRIPEDFSIIGFDNYQTSAFINPPLTTVSRPIAEAGYLAAEYIDRILKSPGSKIKLPRKILPTELVIRKSTAPPPNK
ncbi:MAG: LacI family DNA-binding transcriptional regulator [Victivallales bacterium]|nr:LacI family DNA-binding transcriptional regulator [Victivallales bacterium]